jgi:transposase-like protein
LKNIEVLEKKLTQKQSKAIILLLEGKSIEEISEALKVHYNTIYRWLETDLLFKRTLNEAKDKVFTEALEDLKTLSNEAVKTLKDLLITGHKDTARLGSAKTILELAIKTKEIEDLEARIEALEGRLGGER